MINIVILGTGNVATHLFQAFTKSKTTQVTQVYGRSKDALIPFSNTTKTTDNLAGLVEADVYIIAITDDAIASFSKQLPFKNRLVVHTSGAVPMEALSNKNRRGIFYPLQSFTKGKEIDFSQIPICVEAENRIDLTLLKNIGKGISKKVVEIDSGKRSKLHLAAVFINNFVNYLYLTGAEITKENALDFELLKPLLFETATKIKSISPFDAQTGPAKRNDKKTIKKHLHLLTDINQKELYKLFTKAIKETYGKKL